MNQLQVVDQYHLHVRFDGRSHTLDMSDLDIGDLSSDQQVRTALATHFEVPVDRFHGYVVEREPNGNMTVRPEAIFG